MEMQDKLVIEKLRAEVRSLQYDCAELQKKNDELSERCKKLATRQPMWPRGYQPKRYTPKHRQQ